MWCTVCTAESASCAPWRCAACSGERCAPVNGVHQRKLDLGGISAFVYGRLVAGCSVRFMGQFPYQAYAMQTFEDLFAFPVGHPAFLRHIPLPVDGNSANPFGEDEGKDAGHHFRQIQVSEEKVVHLNIWLRFFHIGLRYWFSRRLSLCALWYSSARARALPTLKIILRPTCETMASSRTPSFLSM